MDVWLQAVTTVGFPIVMCGVMAYYVKYSTDKNREEISKLNEQHKSEMHEITEAVANNTAVMERLCDKIGESNNRVNEK